MKEILRTFSRILFLAWLCLLFSAHSADARVVLVLSGGGTRGLAHIGVIEVLAEHGIPVAGIVGTSAGALIGALKASGYSPSELRSIASDMDMPTLFSENTGPMLVFTGDSLNARMNTIAGLTYRRRIDGHGGTLGMLTGDNLFQYFVNLMRHVDTTDFNELPIPFAAVAADIRTGERVVLRSGSLPSAMRASMSIPALFEPWEIDGRLLVDGGVISNLPVEIAKEIFPGLPILGVDVSENPTGNRPINTIMDVIDQSLTIVMRRATLEEARLADLVIAPDVNEFHYLDNSAAAHIIERGREVALANIDKIRDLSGSASGTVLAYTPPLATPMVHDLRVQGLPDNAAALTRRRFLSWVGRPLNVSEVENALETMMASPDIASVEYFLDRDEYGIATLVLSVRMRPDLEIGISGYTTNLHSQRGLYVIGAARGVFDEMDSVRGLVRVSHQWGVDISYLTAPEPLNPWKLRLSAQNRVLNTASGSNTFERYVAGAKRLFSVGDVQMGLGAAYERVGLRRGRSFAGPTFFAHYDSLNIPSDPTSGQAWRLNVWWPDFENVLYRFTFFKPMTVGNTWRTYLRFGFAGGNMNSFGHAAFLGAAEELYSISNRPIKAERMAWANIAFRRVISRSIWGIVAAEFFGSYGYAMDTRNRKIASPWEVGAAINIPNQLINLRLAAMYGSEQFKIGFFMGIPIWDHYPLP